jgi:hypothetical protein
VAKLTFRRRDIDEPGKLPNVCCVCGEETTLYKSKKFSWAPSWVFILILAGLLIWVIVALILTKSMTAYLPVCAKHRGHWFRRGAMQLLILLLFVGVFIFGVATTGPAGAAGNDLSNVLCGVGLVGFMVCLLWAAIAQNGAVRPKEITDREMTLVNLSPVFVEATEMQWDDEDARRNRERGRE